MSLFGNKKLPNPPTYQIQDMVDDAINMIMASGYISRNRAYLEKMERVSFEYTPELIANSFAHYAGNNRYHVYTFAGLSLLICTCASIFTVYTKTHKTNQVKRALKWLFNNALGETEAYGRTWDVVDEIKIELFYKKFPEYLVKEYYPQYTELARKMIAFVLGHEIGHIMLGHLDRTNQIPNNVSRNNERSCDLFSCSILQGTGVGSSFVGGPVFLTLIFFFMDDSKYRNHQYGTHPGHRDRVMNMVQSFKNELLYANISEADILNLMR